MKKKKVVVNSCLKRGLKLIVLMKLTFLFITVCFMQVSATVYSQNTRFDFAVKNIAVADILREIEDKSDFRFFYQREQVDVEKKIDLNVSGNTVEEILEIIFSDQTVEFDVRTDNLILIKPTVPKSSLPDRAAQQPGTITGIVTDTNGQPLPGVTVLVKGTTTGTISNADGNYSLTNVPENATLVFSFVGMRSLEQNVGNQSTINVSMEEETIGIEEVVAVGYGVQRKVDLTGAVGNVKAENLNIEGSPNILSSLQGKLAGVEIVSAGGEPGSNTNVMIRGVGTFNNNSPLYIVDGMYMDNINFLNPADIESIDVLKDASSAAIYGSRAANGVIIVTTKSGSDTNGVPTISASANIGFQQTTKKIDVLNASDWITISTISREAAGRPPLDMALEQQADINWQDELMQMGLMQNYNISAQGGTQSFYYYIGGGYTNQEGIIKNTDYDRLNFQVKSEFKKGIVTVGENIITSFETRNPVERRVSRVGGIVGSMLNSIPTYNIYNPENDGGYNGPWGDAITWANPVGMINLQQENREHYKTFVNTYLMLDFNEHLQYKLNVNTNLTGNNSFSFEPHYTMGLNARDRNTMSESRGQTKSYLIENLVTYDRTFDNHKLTVLAGYTFQNNKYRVLSAGGSYMADGITVIDAATETEGGSNQTVSSLTSYLGRIFYSYKNKYLLSATIRRDGSSKFLGNNRYGYFPSFSLGWNIGEESFMANFENLDMFKLRAGYGVLGNQEVGNYLYSADVNSNINYLVDGSNLWPGAFPKIFASPSIKWENTEMTNFGLDAAFFNSQLTATVEYYIKNTTDILLNVPIPPSTGAGNDPLKNAGEIRNKGFEFMVGYEAQRTNDLYYSINLVGNTVSNEVVKMGTGDQVIWSGRPNQSGGFTTKSLQGYPIGGFWLIETDGLFRSIDEVNAHSKNGNLIQPNAQPGDIRFRDINDDGVINDDDRIYQGSPFPTFTLGMNSLFNWKNIDFNIGIQANFGAKIYNSMRPDLEDVSKGSNYSTAVLDHWTTNNPEASFPRIIWGDPNQNARTDSDRFLENGDYIRLTSVQLGYQIPRSVVPFFTSFRLFVNAENLFTITNYSGFTPDVNGGSALERGVDRYTYPLPRTVSLGLNLSF